VNRSLKCGLVLLCLFVALSVGVVLGEKSIAGAMAQSNALSMINAGSNADAADAKSAIIESVTYGKASQSVEIKNNETSALDLTGWKLEAQNKTVYTFPKFALDANAVVRVHSGAGKNSKADLYAAAAILTKSDDEVTLRDTTGNVISTSEESKEASDGPNDA